MADISFTVDGKTFTFQEGEVEKISSKITSNIEPEAIPSLGPLSAYFTDYNGPIKTITITGVLMDTTYTRVAGYSVNTIIEQKQWLESMINGAQTSVTFTSNYETTTIISVLSATPPYLGGFGYTKGFIQDISFDETIGETGILNFSITLVVAGSGY